MNVNVVKTCVVFRYLWRIMPDFWHHHFPPVPPRDVEAMQEEEEEEEEVENAALPGCFRFCIKG